MGPVPGHEFAKKQFTITLTARESTTPIAHIHIRIDIDNIPCSSKAYSLANIYLSTVWPEALREAETILIELAPGDRTDKASRLAMNHTFAGLLMFLDAASETKLVLIKLLDGHTLLRNEINELLRPVSVWCRRTANFVECKTEGAAEKITDRLKKEMIWVSRSDDSVDRVFSAVRMVVRASRRFDHAGLSKHTMELRDERGKCLKNMGFVGPGCTVPAEAAVQGLQKLLSRLIETL